ncbi:MAG: ABC transporter ATP-binding protein [Firmicutes bacterium]|nr:ABC transporter ATP-binding protein [Bacillota bacterium]MCL5039977.1 ABC transporter ATP-binding protein [Bacillota bacterium]
MSSMLKVEDLHAFIGQFHILHGVNLGITTGSIAVILGRNGAGKTTTLRSIMGLVPKLEGSITFDGKELIGLTPEIIARLGIGYVPEDQAVFSSLTVAENLRLVARNKEARAREEMVLELFPDLKVAWTKKGKALSGGQKQMLAIGRALINPNRLLLIDEPSKGLAPVVIEKVIQAVSKLKDHTTVILVEQNYLVASHLGESYHLLDNGRTVHTGTMEELRQNDDLRKRYLAVG